MRGMWNRIEKEKPHEEALEEFSFIRDKDVRLLQTQKVHSGKMQGFGTEKKQPHEGTHKDGLFLLYIK